MLVYEIRMPDVTVTKLNDCEHQMYPVCKLEGSQKYGFYSSDGEAVKS